MQMVTEQWRLVAALEGHTHEAYVALAHTETPEAATQICAELQAHIEDVAKAQREASWHGEVGGR